MRHAVRIARLAPLLAAASLLVGASTPPPPAFAQVPVPLLEGVGRIAAPGVPGPLCVFGPDAVPVVVGDAGGGTRLPVVAAGPLGRGRVVAFGHDGYFGRAALDAADTGRLLENAVRWAAGARSSPVVGAVGVPGAAAVLRERGLDVREIGIAELAGLDVVVLVPWNPSGAEVAALDGFARNGGGLVLAVTGWGWAQLHPDRDLRSDFAGNRLLAAAGIQWADDWLGETDPAGGYLTAPPSPLTAAGPALDAAVAHDAGDLSLSPAEIAQASRTLVANALCAPDGDALFLPGLRSVTSDVVVPSPEDPVRPDEVLDRVAVTLQTRELDALPVAEARAHPASARFPGAVPAAAPRIAVEADVPAASEGWISTGAYAAPGDVVTIRLPAASADGRLALQIGSHTDRLWGVSDPWRRMPDIVRRWPLRAAETRVFSPYGGLVYLVPERPLAEPAAVAIEGVVAAPRFVLGASDQGPEAWRAALGASHAPWGEVEGRAMIVTTHAAALRALDDPAELARTWDDVLRSAAILRARPDPDARARPERFVADEQISAGYMHSGYPLMCHLDQAENLVSVANLRQGNWGFFHEVGHNHQHPDWTFDGTGEVTVNLFTLFAYETVSGVAVRQNERGSAAFVRKQLAKVDWDAPDFGRWKSDPFLALAMYVQLQHAFGWQPFMDVFAAYDRLPDEERPRDDAAKRDQWMTRFARAVGRDLGPFFEAWGVPTSPEARASIADLPPWLPAGFPPGYDDPPTPSPTPPGPSPSPVPTARPTEDPPGRASAIFVPVAHGGG